MNEKRANSSRSYGNSSEMLNVTNLSDGTFERKATKDSVGGRGEIQTLVGQHSTFGDRCHLKGYHSAINKITLQHPAHFTKTVQVRVSVSSTGAPVASVSKFQGLTIVILQVLTA